MFFVNIARLAYPQTGLDSLIMVAERAEGDSIAIAYNAVGIQLCYSDPQRSLPYLEKALESAKKYNDYKQQCVACSFMGTSNRYLGNYTKALEHFSDQLEVALSQNITDEVVWANINLGNIMTYMKNYELAREHLNRALQVAEDLGDESVFQYVYVNLGRVNLLSKDYDQALLWHGKALEIRKTHLESPINIAVTYRDMGNVHFERKWYDSTKYYYAFSMQILDTLPENAVKGSIYTNLAHVYLDENNIDSAIYYGEMAVSFANKFHNGNMERDANLIMGDIRYTTGDYGMAEKFYRRYVDYDKNQRSYDVHRQIINMRTKNEQYVQKMQIQEEERMRRVQLRLLMGVFLLAVAGITIGAILYIKRRNIKEINEKLNSQTHQLKSSIEYAGRIQKSILPEFGKMGQIFTDKAVLYRPREVVSGDFYWHHDTGRYEMLAVCDSGANGIPGGFMSMLGSSLLHMVAENLADPASILREMRISARELTAGNGLLLDYSGMDASLMVIDKPNKVIYYSGIKSPLLYMRGGIVYQLQENSISDAVREKSFVTDTLRLEPGDQVYIMSYGCCVQKGGPHGEPYTVARLAGFIQTIGHLPMSGQMQAISNEFDNWRGALPLKEDVTLAGFVFAG